MNTRRKLVLSWLLVGLMVAVAVWAETVTLLDGVTTNSNGPSTAWPLRSAQGCGNVVIYGTWDTATVTLEHSLDNGSTWMNFEDEDSNTVTCTANCEFRICIDKRHIRLAVSSVGGSTDLDARIGG